MQMETNRDENKTTCKTSFFSNKKNLWILAVCFVLVCAFCTLTVLALNVSKYDKIYPNITCEGIEVGGLSKEEAVEKLNKEYLPKFNEKEYVINLYDWKLEKVEKSVTLKASDIDALPDIDLVVKAAYQHARGSDLYKRYFEYLSLKRKGLKMAMPGEVNEEKLLGIVENLAEGMETPLVETSYSVEGNILTIKNGHGGRFVNKETSKANIRDGVFSLQDEIKLFVDIKENKKVDIDKLYEEITNSKKDAYFEKKDGEIIVVDEFPKVKLDKEKLRVAIESGLDAYEIEVETEVPEVTGDELRSLLFRDNMGSWTSSFSASNVPRSSNVRLTASRIDGTVLMPGEVFSYDNAIGKRTASNGYKVAGVYVGNKVEEGIGGGICQTSSTLYSAVLYSNLEIVTRTSHSLPVSYMPAGQDATIAEGYIDFKFKNNTEYPIKIVCKAGQSSVSCSILGVKPQGQTVEVINTRTSTNEPKLTRELDDSIPKGYKKISQKGAIGYNISSQRIVKMNGVETKREKLTNSKYRATDTIELVNPQDKDTPSESLIIYDETAYKESLEKEETVTVSGENITNEEVPEDNTEDVTENSEETENLDIITEDELEEEE